VTTRTDAPIGTLVSLMLVALVLLAVQDAMAKVLGEAISIWQYHLIRSIFVIGLIGIYAWAKGIDVSLRVSRPGWAILRGALMYAAFLLFYLSLTLASFSQAAAAFFTMPLYITLLGMIFGGERASAARLAALGAGFTGVLLIVRPWADEPAFGLVYALAGAVCYALAMAMTRIKLTGDGSMGVYAVQAFVYIQISVLAIMAVDLLALSPETVKTMPFLLTGWTVPEGAIWWILLATAITHLAGSIALIRAYQTGEAGMVAPLEYMYLPVATLIDIGYWGVTPSVTTLAGMALIAGAGIVIARSGST
jgi:drug/metabolite transporter (DMT)-like permease